MPETGASSMQKASLHVVSGQVTPTKLPFLFNPSEYTVAKTSSWSRPTTKGAKSSGKAEFQGAGPQTLQMEVFFDDYEGGTDIASKVATLLAWVKPTENSIQKKKPEPPTLEFVWGQNKALAGFVGYLKSVSVKYTLFRVDGTPCRASANITLEEVPPEVGKQNPTSGSIHALRSRILRGADSLASIAYDEYGNAALWRGLAAFNEIDDPFRVVPGTTLLIPAIEEAIRLS